MFQYGSSSDATCPKPDRRTPWPRLLGLPVIDTMVGFPTWVPLSTTSSASRPRTANPKRTSSSPRVHVQGRAQGGAADDRCVALQLMDRFGIERAMIGVGEAPRSGAETSRSLRPLRRAWSTRTTGWTRPGTRPPRVTRSESAPRRFPGGDQPAGPDRRQEVVPDLCQVRRARHPDLRMRRRPGPRVPFAPQQVSAIDVVLVLPRAVFVTRHGCEPWEELAVKLLLKWPNLYYSTSAFAPKYYPKAIIDYANSRGADKISTPATSRWACRWSGSSPNCPTFR